MPVHEKHTGNQSKFMFTFYDSAACKALRMSRDIVNMCEVCARVQNSSGPPKLFVGYRLGAQVSMRT